VRPAPRRGAHRRRRPRRPMAGMLLHQDGSRHLWLPALGRQIDLVATVDDATSELVSAFLFEEEGTASSFRGLAETIAAKGPCLARSTPTQAGTTSRRPGPRRKRPGGLRENRDAAPPRGSVHDASRRTHAPPGQQQRSNHGYVNRPT
jgi:hypothetical protein